MTDDTSLSQKLAQIGITGTQHESYSVHFKTGSVRKSQFPLKSTLTSMSIATHR